MARTIRALQRFLPAVALLGALAGLAARVVTVSVRQRAEGISAQSSMPLTKPEAETVLDVDSGLTYRDLQRAISYFVGLVLLIWLAYWFVGRVQDVLTLVALSAILAVAIRPTVDRLSSDRVPYLNRAARRALAILTIYLAMATVIAAIGLIIVPQVVEEAQRFLINAPNYLQQFDQLVRSLPGGGALPPLTSLSNQLAGQLFATIPQALNVIFLAINTVTGAISGGVVLVITFFLIMDADSIYKHFTSLVPPAHRGRTREMTEKMGRKIEGWLRGIIVLSVSVGIVTSLGMWALGMPYPLLLGAAAALAELIPLAGPYLASAPGILVALFQPTWELIAVLIFFIVVQMAENNILAPTVMGREVEIPPLLVIVALLIGASLLGFLGAVLALPVAAVVQVLWLDLVVPEIKRGYVERGG